MNQTVKKFSLVFLFLFLFALCAGCASTPAPSNTTTTLTTGTTVPGSGPAYVAGDIIKSPTSTSPTAWLIISYDVSTDTYQRAVIYPNTDGSWGYRLNSNSVQSSRMVIDRDYTKITNKALSSIPIRTPTIPATPTTVTPTVTVTVTSTTVLSNAKPTIKNIVPDMGDAGTAISITSLSGTNFQDGATVMLTKSGNPNITSSNVNVQSSTLITCTLLPPANATAGSWDVVVTNLDGQYAVFTNLFSIHNTGNPEVTVTSTGGIVITRIDPTFTASSGLITVMVYGSNFQDGVTAKLTKSGSSDIVASSVFRQVDTTVLKCVFPIPKQSTGIYNPQGTWNLVLTNTDGTTGTLENAFLVRI